MNEVREDHALALDSISLSVSGCSFIILSPPPISFPSLQDYSCHHTYCYFSHHKSKQANKNQLLDPTPFPYSPSQQNSRKTFLYSLPPIPLSSHSLSNARQSGFCLPTILWNNLLGCQDQWPIFKSYLKNTASYLTQLITFLLFQTFSSPGFQDTMFWLSFYLTSISQCSLLFSYRPLLLERARAQSLALLFDVYNHSSDDLIKSHDFKCHLYIHWRLSNFLTRLHISEPWVFDLYLDV